MNKIANKLDKINRRIKFTKYCFNRGTDSRFINDVYNIGQLDNQVFLEKNDDKTPDRSLHSSRVLYHIKMEYSGSGFFADHNRLLTYLYFADIYGLIPVVEFHPDYCYAEKHPVNNTTNPFEYYFKQPCGVSLEELNNTSPIIRSKKDNCGPAGRLNPDGNGYHKSDIFVEKMADITSKYIHLRDDIREQIEHDINGIIPDVQKTLAFHYRGADFKRNYHGHPIQASIEEYVTEIDNLLQTGRYEYIFLATDDKNIIDICTDKYGDKVRYYDDVTRTSDDETVMLSNSSRPNHHYLLGFEVLRDMMTLSACNGLLAGLSQVSFAARIQKLSTGKGYKDCVILDKGINTHVKATCPNA